jgi:hypothetical protein
VYPLIQEYSEEILDDLLVGMQRVIKRNPDSSFSIQRLIGRAVSDLLILSPNTKELALICEVLNDDYGTRYLYVWGAYAVAGVKFDIKTVEKSMRWLGQQTECKYVELASHRIGWAKALEPLGLEILPVTTYRIQI